MDANVKSAMIRNKCLRKIKRIENQLNMSFFGLQQKMRANAKRVLTGRERTRGRKCNFSLFSLCSE